MKHCYGFLFTIFIGFFTSAQGTQFLSACQQAYQACPQVPRGVLEAVSFTQTRFAYLSDAELESCSGLPKSHGYLGMVQNGKQFFRSNMRKVADLSGISQTQIRQQSQQEILAYARAFEVVFQESYGDPLPIRMKRAFSALSYIPDTGIVHQFALQSELYELFRFLNKADNATQFGFPNYQFNLEQVFGATNLAVLSAPKVIFTPTNIYAGGVAFVTEGQLLKSTEYGPAIWNPAPSCNFSSRNGTAISAITIHTIQGTYAGAISWSQNCSSSVSYHYVLRSSDGQVTQMVNEANKAWHVGSENPYTIGYEHEGYVSQSTWYTTAMYNASAALSRDVCQSGYGINPLRTFSGTATSGSNVLGSCIKIKGHQHYPNQTHTDPGIYWNWALYYQLINNNPSQTTVTTATGSFMDTGGAGSNYSDDQRYFTLIQPANASSVTLTFSSFNLEANWDYMYIYDGATTSAPLIGTYTGTISPGTVTSTGGSLLIEFRSDCATTAAGWQATWSSVIQTPTPVDATAPTTAISAPTTWVTQAFTTTFTDADNQGGSGIEKAYYQVLDYDGSDWRANANNGFFSDNFDQATLHADWTSQVGTWGLNGGYLVQSDEANGNTNVWAGIDHSLSNRYLYHWAGKLDGAGTNRRAGMHYFCSDPTLTNRGNSYFVFFRLDDDKVQLYEVTNDVFTLVNEVSYNFVAGTWYDFKVIYDRISGKHQVYVENVQVTTWTDPTPLAGGNYLSFRSGNCNYAVNNLKVYRSRATSVSVGVGATEMLRYQSTNPTTAAGRIKSIVQDSATNLSALDFEDVFVDWTAPIAPTYVHDGTGADITTTTNNNLIEANWDAGSDPHSDVARYWVSVGSSAGATNVVNWTDNYWNTSFALNGLNLAQGTTYYVNVRVENGAGLISSVISSNGQLVVPPTDPPLAAFNSTNTFVCAGTPIDFQNTSVNATSYAWSFPGGSPASSAAVNPQVVYPASGTYTVELIVSGPGGLDIIQQQVAVQVSQPNQAAFTVNTDTLYLPSAILTCSNGSQNANGYLWNFGDGTSSQDTNPWHQYGTAGTYEVELIAANNSCPADTSYQTIVVIGGAGLEVEEMLWSIYPNPTTDEVIVNWEKPMSGTLICLDEKGSKVGIYPISGQSIAISTGAWSAGVYYLTMVKQDGQVSTTKQLIRH
jgi:PKD repeat protein